VNLRARPRARVGARGYVRGRAPGRARRRRSGERAVTSRQRTAVVEPVWPSTAQESARFSAAQDASARATKDQLDLAIKATKNQLAVSNQGGCLTPLQTCFRTLKRAEAARCAWRSTPKQPCTLCDRDAQLHQRRAKWREQSARAVLPRSAPDMLLTLNSDATSQHN